MNRTGIRAALLIGLTALVAAALWPLDGRGQGGPAPPRQPGQPDRIRQLERSVDLLKAQVKQLNATMDQMMELMERLNTAVRDPQVQKQLAELRAARQPAATGKNRKLADLTDVEKAEIMQLEGVVKISSNPVEDQGRLVARLWDFCVYEAVAREMDKLLHAEDKSKGDRWKNMMADRLNREFVRFEKPEHAEAFLKIVLEHPLALENEKGLAWVNSSAGACRQLYTADPGKFKDWLARAIKLYEVSIKLNPGQVEVRETLKSLQKAKADAEKKT